MKKLFASISALILIVCGTTVAMAGPLNNLTISSDMAGGVTTVGTSGVSTMYVNQGAQYVSAVNDGPIRVVQVKEIDYSQAQQGAGGTVSGTFDLIAVWSLDKEDFASGETIYAYKKERLTSLTNNTVAPVSFRVKPGGFLQYRFVTSGTTPYDKVHIVEKALEKDGDYDVSPPLEIAYYESAFATTGVTQFWSGTTAIVVAPGATCVEVTCTGDDIWYTTDGTTEPIDGKSTFLEADQKPFPLTKHEWEHFWWRSDGDANGYLIIRQRGYCE